DRYRYRQKLVSHRIHPCSMEERTSRQRQTATRERLAAPLRNPLPATRALRVGVRQLSRNQNKTLGAARPANRKKEAITTDGGEGGRRSSPTRRKRMSVETIEDIAVLGTLLVFGSVSLAVIVLMY